MTDVAAHALAIANLKALYCRAADVAAGDPARARSLLSDVFAEDCVGDYGYGPVEGPTAIMDFLCTAIAAGSDWMIHMLHSPRIRVDGDRATGEWTVMVHSRRRKGGGVSVVIGRYCDNFRLTLDGWRIARIAFWKPS